MDENERMDWERIDKWLKKWEEKSDDIEETINSIDFEEDDEDGS